MTFFLTSTPTFSAPDAPLLGKRNTLSATGKSAPHFTLALPSWGFEKCCEAIRGPAGGCGGSCRLHRGCRVPASWQARAARAARAAKEQQGHSWKTRRALWFVGISGRVLQLFFGPRGAPRAFRDRFSLCLSFWFFFLFVLVLSGVS